MAKLKEPAAEVEVEGPVQVRLQGESGRVWTFDLPLAESFRDQITKGTLHPADDESVALLAASAPADDVDAIAEPDPADPDGSGDPPAPVVETPARNASRDDWAAYAVTLGLDIEETDSRDDIIGLVDEHLAELGAI